MAGALTFRRMEYIIIVNTVILEALAPEMPG